MAAWFANNSDPTMARLSVFEWIPQLYDEFEVNDTLYFGIYAEELIVGTSSYSIIVGGFPT